MARSCAPVHKSNCRGASPPLLIHGLHAIVYPTHWLICAQVRATAHCSYLQIYGDRVQDLLVPDPSKAPALQVREAPSNLGSKGAVFVRGLSEYQVASAADVLTSA